MGTEIYYFSGTGNSLYVAKNIAEKTKASLTPIASVIKRNSIKIKADVIGIVFPVYYMELPMIVEEFAKKLEDINGKYIFAVCTHGGAAGASLRMMKSILRSKGGMLSAGYGIHMPQNSFYKPNEDHQKINLNWQRKLELVVKNIEDKKRGIFYTNILLEALLIPIHFTIIKPMCIKHFKKISKLPSHLKYEEHKYAMDKNFYTNENCSGCESCSKVCPVNNIIIRDNKPNWLGHCEHCLACYNWCPNKAIKGGITKDYFYRHPEVKAEEIMKQKSNVGGNP